MTNEESQTRIELAAAYRLVHKFSWDDVIFTHLSAKIPDTEHFLINQYGLRFDEITASNLVKVDLHGNVMEGGIINPAGFVIHSAIHEARPDVHCIIHTHTKEGIAVSADSRGLLPISQQSAIVLKNLAYHDYQGIVVDDKEKEDLKRNLGKKNFLILRNHGLLTAHESIPSAFRAMYHLQRACEMQVLCNTNHINLIPQEAMDNFQNRSDGFTNSTPSQNMLWEALIRTLDDSYKL
jgi:ribulose-5-phosphate 4-epimerase/fuculose-1-phosphate aldolase